MAAAAASATVLITLHAAFPFAGGTGSDALAVAPLLLWTLSPYVALIALALWGARSVSQLAVTLGGCLVVATTGLVVLLDGLVLHPSLPNTLLLVAVPGIQWAVTATTGAVALLLRVVGRRRG